MLFPKTLLVIVVLCSCVTFASAAADFTPLLTSGVKEIAAPGIPGPLCVYGNKAWSVVVGKTGKDIYEPVVAAADFGKGRIVAFGHDGYVGAETLNTADTGQLMINSIKWSSGGSLKPVGVRGCPEVLVYLKSKGLDAQDVDFPDWTSKLKDYSALVCVPWNMSSKEIATVRGYIKNGGGLVVSALGWGWLQLNPGKRIQEHPGNRLLDGSGIQWADGYFERTTKDGFAVGKQPMDLLNATMALNLVESAQKAPDTIDSGKLQQASQTLSRALRTLPANDKMLLPKLNRLISKQTATSIPTDKTPVTNKEPLARLLVALQYERTKDLAANKVKAHPAAFDFPGQPTADTPKPTKTIEIDTSVAEWHSTGLYAPAGGVVEVTVPREAVGKLSVRIGCHSDELWDLDSWHRFPSITMQRSLSSMTTKVASPFGGLVYIVVPENCGLGNQNVSIKGPVEAPRYVLGQTSLEDWRSRIRNLPGPWAELETNKVIFSLPSSVVRKLDDPESLMKFWDRVMDACADLAARPRDRERPERYCNDRQISAGYMHSGYPIMTWMDVTQFEVDLPKLMSNDRNGDWGFFHEMGHNHQSDMWTFNGFGEVTENLFSVYILETVCSQTVNTHSTISPEERTKRMTAYFSKPVSYERLTADPFLALLPYLQVVKDFGWEPIKKTFAEYRTLPGESRPKNEDEKRDQWLVRFSKAVGRNLGPFYDTWGFPTSDQAKTEVKDLPIWMPENFPPK